MTRQDAIEVTREALIAGDALAAHLARLWQRIGDRFPLKVDPDRDDASVERIHALLHMFEQLHDLIGRRLFRGAITLVQEDATALSARALVLRLEQLGAIETRADWLTLNEVRNTLVHEYPLSADAFASQANLAARHLDMLLSYAAQIARYLRSEGIME